MKEKEIRRSGLTEMEGEKRAMSSVREGEATRKAGRRNLGREGGGLGEQDRLSCRGGLVSGVDQVIMAAVSMLRTAVVMAPMRMAALPVGGVPMAMMAGSLHDGPGGEEADSPALDQKTGQDQPNQEQPGDHHRGECSIFEPFHSIPSCGARSNRKR